MSFHSVKEFMYKESFDRDSLNLRNSSVFYQEKYNEESEFVFSENSEHHRISEEQFTDGAYLMDFLDNAEEKTKKNIETTI